MTDLFVDLAVSQLAKTPAGTSGDVVQCRRTAADTTIVIADGIGSGPHANVAATLCIARLFGLLKGGRSPRDTFVTLVRSMQEIRDVKEPYAVFTLLRVQRSGACSLFTYEMPAPLHLMTGLAVPFQQRQSALAGASVGEGHGRLEAGDAILLMSDGVTNAGMGNGLPLGWTSAGVERHVAERLATHREPLRLADAVTAEARRLWGPKLGDDTTAVVARCRASRQVTILTGPPARRERDAEAVRRFQVAAGVRVICGGTTAAIVARHSGQAVRVMDEESPIAPPRYHLDGVELVTEGAVTLNQVSNLLETELGPDEGSDGPGRLVKLLGQADAVTFLVGAGKNPASGDLAFRQRGILGRAEIVPVLTRKLEAAGKLVVVESLD